VGRLLYVQFNRSCVHSSLGLIGLGSYGLGLGLETQVLGLRLGLDGHRLLAVNDGDRQKVWRVYTPAELAAMQLNDPDIGPIVKLRLEYDEQPPFDLVREQSTNMKVYWSQWPCLTVCDGVVYSVAFDRHGRPDGLQLFIPEQLRSEIIEFVHSALK